MKQAAAFIVLIFSALTVRVNAQSAADSIRLNQLGFYPDAPKIAIVLTAGKHDYTVETMDHQVVFSGHLTQSVNPDFSLTKTWIADFSKLRQTGEFVLNVEGVGRSYSFSIGTDVYKKVSAAAIKGYYYQRASIDLPEKYAGIWHRNEGHPDTAVYVHPSAAGAGRPADFKISSPRGWYDAGDYNKYIVNSGITMGTMLSLYEDFPGYMKTVNLNIPESGNHIPDLLNELLWNLRWMLTMQDPADGGVYHKLTNAQFDPMVMPDQANTKRYVVQKGTASALEFAAVMAQANRVFKNYPAACPGLADSCLKSAYKAWQWALANKDSVYNQQRINKTYTPPVTTGTYTVGKFDEEFVWAAAELYVTTGDAKYYGFVKPSQNEPLRVPSWGRERVMAYYTLIRNKSKLTGEAKRDIGAIQDKLILFADGLIGNTDSTAYETVMGKSRRDFIWGSNALAANQGIALIQAYLITKNKKYINYALSNLDYLLGRNGTGYCYVTGYGSKSPMHPHHRQSVSDGVTPPVPGLLVGGPNPGMQDGMKYRTAIPNQSYLDNDKAYACNEIAINWNAPFVYLVNALNAIEANTSK